MFSIICSKVFKHGSNLESGDLESVGLESRGLEALRPPISDLEPYTLGV